MNHKPRAFACFLLLMFAPLPACFDVPPDVPWDADPRDSAITIDGAMCSESPDCTDSAYPYCVDMVCVECELDDHCSGETPVCDTDAGNACRACRADSECASDVCMEETGACLATSDVIYVDATGVASGTCTQGAPCSTIALGLLQVTGSRNVIKLLDGMYAAQVNIAGLTVTITGGAGAIIRPSGLDQSVMLVTNGANVTLEGVTIRDAGGSPALGVNCSTTGAIPTLTMRGTTVTNNRGGGVSITSCNFDLKNNWIFGNGNTTTATVGGVGISNIGTPGLRVLDFNTIKDNLAGSGVPPGVTCSGIVPALTFSNNIVFDNESAEQVGGANCGYSYSNIGPTAVSGGTGNINSAPTVVDTGSGNYHLQSTSSGIDVADPNATLTRDIDGDARPNNGRSDMGADEVVQ